MSASRALLFAVTAGLVVAACGGGGPATPKTPVAATTLALDSAATPAKPETPKPAPPPVRPKIQPPGPALPPMSYEAKGRRDPFVPLVVAKQRTGIEISSCKLVGIVDGLQLLALVEAPDGLGYIVKPGDVLGNGHVTAVTASSITFAVAGSPGQTETSLTLRLQKD